MIYFLIFLVPLVVTIVVMKKIKAGIPEGQSSLEPLSLQQKILVSILCIFEPVIAGAIFFYGWKNKFPEKSKQANRISWIIFGVLLIVSSAYYYTEYRGHKDAEMNPLQSSWQVYKNNRAGYQFEYPSSATKYGLEETITYPNSQFPNRDVIQFNVGNNTYSVWTEIGAGKNSLESWINSHTKGLSYYERTTVDNKEAYSLKTGSEIYVISGDNIYFIQDNNGTIPSTVKDDPIYSRWLSSFKFISN